MLEQIKILVVDDSAFMRKSLSLLLESDPQIKVIDTASDGLIAIKKIKELKPDIVTLDVEMPNLDGISALKIIMKECPTPVIMVSSVTTEGANVTLEALELGAVDFIPKEMSYISVAITSIKDELVGKVKAIYRNNVLAKRNSNFNKSTKEIIKNKPKTPINLPSMRYKAIAIGISTGGPISLQKVVPLFSGRIKVPIFIVQHMPPKFTKSLADRLNSLSILEVKEAENNEIVRDGVVYIAPGGFHLTLKRDRLNNVLINISELPNGSLHKPSVDVMILSVQETYGKNVLGVIMTGMGKDGLEGIKKVKLAGGHCIAQNEESCVVFGMPRAIVENGLADVIASLEEIPNIINKAM